MTDLIKASDAPAGACTDFDRWRRFQDNSTLDMALIQQAAHYSADEDWHERESDSAYHYRNCI